MIKLVPPRAVTPFVADRAAEFNEDTAREAAALVAFPKEGAMGGGVKYAGFPAVRKPAEPKPPAPDESWRDQAACKGMPTAWFYPDKGAPSLEVKKVCEGCPSRQPCLEYGALETYGIWGGMGERKRKAYRREHGLGWWRTHNADVVPVNYWPATEFGRGLVEAIIEAENALRKRDAS